MALRGEILLDNGTMPGAGVIALAKHDLKPGDRIDRALGGFQCRGEAVPFSWHHQHPPIGLLQNVVVEKSVEAGTAIRWDQISLPESRALTLFRQLLQKTQQAD
jgi:predicted homoserine dehydrogenase-like protein